MLSKQYVDLTEHRPHASEGEGQSHEDALPQGLLHADTHPLSLLCCEGQSHMSHLCVGSVCVCVSVRMFV